MLEEELWTSGPTSSGAQATRAQLHRLQQKISKIKVSASLESPAGPPQLEDKSLLLVSFPNVLCVLILISSLSDISRIELGPALLA